MYKILISILIIIGMAWLSQIGYTYAQKPSHYSFLVEDNEIGKYTTLEQCMSEERRYHKFLKGTESFEPYETVCGWR